MKRRVAVLIVLLLGVAGFVWSRIESPPAAEIPEIRVDELHPLVADAVRNSVRRVQEQPQSAAAWGELGILLIAHEFPEAARTCLSRAAELDPLDFRWPYFLGYSLERDDFERALSHYDRALELNSGSVPLRLRMAGILMRLARFERCRTILDECRRIEPDNPYGLVLRGRLAILQRDVPLAVRLLTKAAERPGWTPQPAYQELVSLSSRRGNFARAYEYQRKLAKLPDVAKMDFPDPVLEDIRRLEALSKSEAERADFALARGDFQTAIAAYQAFLEKRTDLPTPYTNLAQAYAMAGRFPEALATYQKLREKFGESVAAHLGLAATFERAGQPEPAIKHYRAALRIKPNHQRAWFFLGLLFEKQRRLNDAIDCYRNSAKADPSFAQAHLAWGVALLEQNQNEQARPPIARAAALAPNDPVPQGYLRTVDERLKSRKAKQ